MNQTAANMQNIYLLDSISYDTYRIVTFKVPAT